VKVRLHRAKVRLREAILARVGPAAKEVFPLAGERCDRMVAAGFEAIERMPGGQTD
jgi:hypothetical protein